MKSLFKYYIIFLLFSNISNSQTGEITYKVTAPNTASTKERVKKTYEEIDLFSFSLKYNSEKAFFTQNKNVPYNKLNSKIASILVGSNVEYFQTSLSKKTIFYLEIDNKPYIVDKSDRMKNWELSNKTKEIDGYTCYKATLIGFNERAQKQTLTNAWYTLEIPLPYGPIGYGGLPGLILELETSKGFIYTPLSILLNPKTIKLPTIEEGKKINSKQMRILMRKARKVTDD